MNSSSLLPEVLRSLAGALGLLLIQLWIFGPLTPGANAACVCLYLSLLLIAQISQKTVVLPLFLIPIWWLHYIPAPLLAKSGWVDYWFCRIYLETLSWETHYEWTAWSLVPLTIGLVAPLCIPGFLTRRQAACRHEPSFRSFTLSPRFESFLLFWGLGCIGADILKVHQYVGPLSQPVALLLETRIVALGTLIFLAKPRMALAAGAIAVFYELVLAATSGLFAGLFDRILPLTFLVFFRLRWSWQTAVMVLGFFAALYVNEVQKQTVFRVKLRTGEIDSPIAAVSFLGELWYELLTNPDELFGMEARSNFFARVDNQFYIQNALMSRIPTEVPHYQGRRLFGVIENFIPRVIYPDKPVLLDRKEFLYLTGHPLGSGTSMGYGPTGEFYIDFGNAGLIFGMFFYGLTFGFVWRIFNQLGDENPAWWPWFCYLFGMWITQIGAMLVMIMGRTVKGAVVFLLLWYSLPVIRQLLYLPSRQQRAGNRRPRLATRVPARQ